METSQKELDNERQMKMEQLSSPPPEDNRLIISDYSENMQSTLILPFSASKIEDYEKQIEQLQHNLSQNDEERILLEKHLNEVELQLTKSSDDYASTIAKHESLLQERDSLVQQQSIQSTER